ncbi:MAG TPA: PASTA domain-containing protein [Candidatus Faecisoma merdavium]|nr:PASTA domain-containing protein [Candidatus Faecisoma merdavium]
MSTQSNPGFVDLGLKLGKDVLFDYIDKFGFGNVTGVDLNGEANGILFDKDKIGDLELATTAFGQGVSVTPIQQITAVSAAINGGNLYTPYIVKSLNEPETNSAIVENHPSVVRKVITENTSAKVRYVLESVVANGTGRNAYIPNYRVGGKTGTAQKVEDGKYLVGNYITSFMGFLPADDPEVVVYIAIDNAKGVTQYGGTIAAPIAKNVLNASISALNIKERYDGMTKEYNYGDKRYYTVPNVIGMDTKEAVSSLKNFKVEFSGTGSKVIYQSPSEGSYLVEGEIIRLMLGE